MTLPQKINTKYFHKWTIGSMLIVTVLLLGSCRGSKRISKTERTAPKLSAAEQVYQQLLDNQLDVNYFSAKAKIKANDGKQTQNFNADIRLKKDSIFWANVYPPFVKISVAQALITPDSIKVIDRFNKKYYAKGIDYLQQFVSYPLDFNTLQNLILGNPLMEVNENASLQTTEGTHAINATEDVLNMLLQIDSEDLTIEKMTLTDTAKNQSVDIKLKDYEMVGDKPFSNKRQITLKAPEVYTADFDFSKVKINQPLNFPFKVSSKYEVIK